MHGARVMYLISRPTGKPARSMVMPPRWHKSAHYNPNQTIALIFWAEWCPICRTEEGSISNLTQDKTLAFIPIATQSGNAQNVRRIFKERGLNWNAVVDESGEIFRSYQLVGVPAFIVINPDGTVRNVQTGYTSEAGMRLRMR